MRPVHSHRVHFKTPYARHAFTLRELTVVIAVIVVLLCLLSLSLRRAQYNARTMHDASQVGGIYQGLILAAAGGNGDFPLPSEWDKSSATVLAGRSQEKDTTANLYSILIFFGYINPEMLISPHETNPNIRACRTYAYDNPPTAASPRMALWDPAFSVDFTNGKTGNASYAHQLPVWRGAPSDRRNVHPRWLNSFQADEPILASRGPQIASVTNGVPTLANPNSLTLGKHGPADQWQGHVVYNDGHVSLESSLTPPGVLYGFNEQGQTRPDNLFHDEPDSFQGLNAYLGIFPKAGATAADYVSIWD